MCSRRFGREKLSRSSSLVDLTFFCDDAVSILGGFEPDMLSCSRPLIDFKLSLTDLSGGHKFQAGEHIVKEEETLEEPRFISLFSTCFSQCATEHT